MEKNKLVNADVKVEAGFHIVTKHGKVYSFELKKLYDRLANASDEQLNQFTVTPSM